MVKCPFIIFCLLFLGKFVLYLWMGFHNFWLFSFVGKNLLFSQDPSRLYWWDYLQGRSNYEILFGLPWIQIIFFTMILFTNQLVMKNRIELTWSWICDEISLWNYLNNIFERFWCHILLMFNIVFLQGLNLKH